MRKWLKYLFGAFGTLVIIIVLIVLFASNDQKESMLNVVRAGGPTEQIAFDAEKWKVKKGWGYEYRNAMLDALIADPDIRNMHRGGIIRLLGEPERTNEDYLYYLIDQTRAIVMPIHSKFLVIKMYPGGNVEWMKIYE